MDIASERERVISQMFDSFEKSCPPREIKPAEWNLSLVLRSLAHLPYEPLKLFKVKHLTWKTCYRLVLVLTKWVRELHGLSYRICHSKGCRSFTFSFLPDFMGETQSPMCTIPASRSSLFNYWLTLETGTRCCSATMRAIKRYLSKMEQFRPECSSLFTQ